MGNQTPKGLTTEKLRTYKGFQTMTEEELEIALKDIKATAKCLFNLTMAKVKKETNGNDIVPQLTN